MTDPAWSDLSMSKFLALGVPLREVIRQSTTNPATQIKRPDLGQIAVGAEADIAVLRLGTREVRLRGRTRRADRRDPEVGLRDDHPRRQDRLRFQRPGWYTLAPGCDRVSDPLTDSGAKR